MLWKVLDRAMNVSEVSAPGDAPSKLGAILSEESTPLDQAFSKASLLEIDTVGSELPAPLHEYINGDTLSRASDNSSGKTRRRWRRSC